MEVIDLIQRRAASAQGTEEHPTLARMLGTTTHLSALLRKASRLGLDAKKLRILAVQRGCRHYKTGDEPADPLASESEFSNEELGIALICPALPYDPQNIRVGAAILSADGVDPRHLAHLAKMERAEVPLRYIAEAGEKFEPKNEFWGTLLKLLPKTHPPKSGVLPHPTRFITMTGLTRRGREFLTEWQRPWPTVLPR